MRAKPVEVEIDATSQIPRISVFGDCTGSGTDRLLTALNIACLSHPRRVVVDLGSASKLDGSTLARLLEFRRRLPETVVTIDVRGIASSRLMSLVDDATAFAA